MGYPCGNVLLFKFFHRCHCIDLFVFYFNGLHHISTQTQEVSDYRTNSEIPGGFLFAHSSVFFTSNDMLLALSNVLACGDKNLSDIHYEL